MKGYHEYYFGITIKSSKEPYQPILKDQIIKTENWAILII